MSKVARVVGVIAAVVATAAGVAAMFIPGGQIFGIALLKIAAIAAAVSTVANAVALATAPKARPPDALGSVNEVLIGANLPIPYSMGRTYIGGNMAYEDSAGTKSSDRTRIFVGSHGGPIEGFESALFDFAPVTFATNSGGVISGAATGYYAGFLFADTRLGARPDTALAAVGGRPAFANWTSASKLSGMASWFFDMVFDEKGERWSSGIPATGMVAKWVWTYDPRLDSSYPGGSGAHRWDDESSWSWSENPALHALTYARGRFMGAGNVKVVGCGISEAAIDLSGFVELANVCDANGWTIGGTVYEGPGISKWNNLKRILDTAAAEPCWVGGVLTVKISAPKTALDTITKDDLTEGDVLIPAMSEWKGRFNTIFPRYRSEDHRWDYVDADPVVNATYLAEDGETKSDEQQYDFIQDADQAAQRAAYGLANGREFGPMQLPLKRRLRVFRPGEALNVDLASICDDPGLGVQLAVITGRTVDPATSAVTLELVSETTAKHAWALGLSGTAPPSPTIPSAGDNDQAVAATRETPEIVMSKILESSIDGLTFSVDAAGVATVSTHDRIYRDRTVTVTGATVAAPSGTIAASKIVAITYHDPDRLGGSVTYESTLLSAGDELPKPTSSDPYLHAVAAAPIPASGTTSGGSGIGDGGGGGGTGGGWGTQPNY